MRIAVHGPAVVTLPRDVAAELRALAVRAGDASSAVRVDDHTALVAVVRAGVAAIGAQLDTDPHALLRALVDGGAQLDVAELVFASSDLRHAARHDDRARRARREAT